MEEWGGRRDSEQQQRLGGHQAAHHAHHGAQHAGVGARRWRRTALRQVRRPREHAAVARPGARRLVQHEQLRVEA